jgi:hypothetical protein
MQLIKKIEIHRFRSISDISIEAAELTILSGLNNSGKSNVLRALNLFFNGETSYGSPFNFRKDYNRAFTGQARGKREIKITLHFDGQGEAALKYPFNISRSFEDGPTGTGRYEFHSSNKEIEKKLERSDGNVRRQFTTFINKILFFYVPAVRDRDFVQSLLLNFERLIEDDRDSNFEGKLTELSSILEQKSVDISKDFESFIGLPTEARLSTNMTDILSAIEVNVDSGIEVLRRTKGTPTWQKVKINLFSSGDGVLMSYLAYFLAHISKKLQNRKIIWGFEEPENSLEYSKIQKLADDFTTKFKKDAQIFITTHAPAFINLRNDPATSFYRAYINPVSRKKITEINTLKTLDTRQQRLFKRGEVDSKEYEIIQKELGLIDLAQEIERATEELLVEKRKYAKEREEYIQKNKTLINTKPLKIFICEDGKSATVRLWKKLLREAGIKNVVVLPSNGITTEEVEIGVRHVMRLDKSYKPKLFREVDRDGLTDDQIKAVQKGVFKKYESVLNYSYEPLPVHELENFAVLKKDSFDASFWNHASEDVRNTFDSCAENICRDLDKKLRYAEPVFKSGSGNYMHHVQTMRAEALRDWKKYMPGKEMCKKVDNLNPITYLYSLNKNELPDELIDYLNRVKAFFEG